MYSLASLIRLTQASQKLMVESTIEGLLQRVVDTACELTGARLGMAAFGYRVKGFKYVSISSSTGGVSPVPSAIQHVLIAGIFRHVLDRSTPLRLTDQDLRCHPAWQEPLTDHVLLNGLLGVNLAKHDGQSDGLIAVSDKEGGEFTDEDEVLLTQLAALASMGLQHLEARNTAERRAEEQDAVITAMTDAVIVYDENGVPVDANLAAIRAFGIQSAEMELQAFLQKLNFRLLNGNPIAASQAPSRKSLQGEHIKSERLVYTDREGIDHTIVVSASPLLINCKPAGSVAIWHDVTERQRIYDELELRVQERTRKLAQTNEELLAEIAERNRAEEQLRLQMTAVEAAANGVVITDNLGNVQWCNPAFTQMTGYTVEEVYGQNLRFLKSGEHDAEFYHHLWATILSGKVWRGETINRRKDGELYTEEQTITPVVNQQGLISHLIAIKQDITERKRQEDQIKENTSRAMVLAEVSRALVESGLDLQVIFNTVTGIVAHSIGDACVLRVISADGNWLNPVAFSHPDPDILALMRQLLKASRYRVDQGFQGVAIQSGEPLLIPGAAQDDFHASPNPEYLAFLERFGLSSLLVVPLRLNGHVAGTLTLSRDLGHPPYAQADLLLLQSLADRMAMAIANVQQIDEIRRLYLSETSQRQLAEALSQAGAALNASLDLDHVLDLILDQTLRVVPGYGVNLIFMESGSPRLIRYRGYANPSHSLANLSEPVHSMTPYLQKMLETGQPVLVTDTAGDPDWVVVPGTEWLRSYVGVPLRSGDLSIGFLGVDSEVPNFFGPEAVSRLDALAAHAALAIHNARLYQELQTYLKQEKAMRSQLIQAEKLTAMGRMVASVAHELNNPLQTIKNCLFLLQQENLDLPAHEYLTIATAETQRISHLVMQLREMYRQKNPDEMSPVELSKTLDEVYALLQPHLQRQRVVWRLLPGPSQLFVSGASDQLKQVFLNLCFNAIEAMQPEGGELTAALLLDSQAGLAGIQFQDSGPGIPAENFPHLFDPFFTTKDGGTGLGLSISFEIVQRHSGRIEVTNQPKSGAVFTVWLPLIGGPDIGSV